MNRGRQKKLIKRNLIEFIFEQIEYKIIEKKERPKTQHLIVSHDFFRSDEFLTN